MASSSSTILPISNPQTITTGGVVESQPPITTPAFRAFISNVTDTIRNDLSQCRPWYELVDRSAFSTPESISVVLGISLLTNPFALIILDFLAAWLFLYLFRPFDPRLVVFGLAFSKKETLGILILSSVIMIFLISALMVGLAIIFAHGACRVPEDLFLDAQEPAATRFLSFLSGSASNTAATAAYAVAARV